jgi:hypothetical protein
MNYAQQTDIRCLPALFRQLLPHLAALDWSHGLTRDDLRVQIPDVPPVLYLHLPAAKRFASPFEVRRMALTALARAEGEFVTAADVIDERQIMDLGGPPAWGPDPLIAGFMQEGGSATDTASLTSACA